jgi:hypothetical protein
LITPPLKIAASSIRSSDDVGLPLTPDFLIIIFEGIVDRAVVLERAPKAIQNFLAISLNCYAMELAVN